MSAEIPHCPCCGAAEPHWDGRRADKEYWERDAEVDRLRGIETAARDVWSAVQGSADQADWFKSIAALSARLAPHRGI